MKDIRYLISYFYKVSDGNLGEGRVFVTSKGEITEEGIKELETRLKRDVSKDISVEIESLLVNNFKRLK